MGFFVLFVSLVTEDPLLAISSLEFFGNPEGPQPQGISLVCRNGY